MRRRDRRVSRAADGTFRLHLPDREREVLRTLPAQLRELLAVGDPALERLFPPAYLDDPEQQAEYASLVHDDLLRQRATSLEVMEETIDADRLDEEQLSAWLSALNDLRLVLGTRLGITEDMYEEGLPEEGPDAPKYAVYAYLGWLEEQVVAALAEGL
ncbi:MAG TPA: DUF2017 family protein [Actinomycetota bacterium]